MTPNQILWSRSRDNLISAVTALGFSSELGDLLARELGSPKAIDRMTSYVRQAHPRTEEMLVDEIRKAVPCRQNLPREPCLKEQHGRVRGIKNLYRVCGTDNPEPHVQLPERCDEGDGEKTELYECPGGHPGAR